MNLVRPSEETGLWMTRWALFVPNATGSELASMIAREKITRSSGSCYPVVGDHHDRRVAAPRRNVAVEVTVVGAVVLVGRRD